MARRPLADCGRRLVAVFCGSTEGRLDLLPLPPRPAMPRTARTQSAAYRELVATLVELREVRGLSQRQLAEILEVSPAHVGKVERCDTPLRLDDVGRWAVAL